MLESAAFINGIKNRFLREEFPAKSLLVKEGTKAKKLYFLETGCCRCWLNADDGREITIQFSFEGSFISSMDTISSNSASWFSVETLEATVVYSLPVTGFKELKANHPEVEAAYHAYNERRLVHYQKLFVSRIKDSPEKRYRELLEKHPGIIARVPQHYIASFLGITSVSLSRIRNRR